MNAFFHWFEYPFQSHIGSNICSSQVPRAKSQVPSVKWPSPLIRSLTLYQRLMTVPPQGTNCPFHNRERTTCGTQDEAGTCAGPSPPKIRSSTQHQCFTNVPQKGANDVSHSAGSRNTCRPPLAVVGVGGVREQLRLGRLVLLDGLFWFSEQLIELLLREAFCPANHACFHHHPRGHF